MRTHVAIAVLLAAIAAPAHAQQPDARWSPWLGCWQMLDERVREGNPSGADAVAAARQRGLGGTTNITVCVCAHGAACRRDAEHACVGRAGPRADDRRRRRRAPGERGRVHRFAACRMVRRWTTAVRARGVEVREPAGANDLRPHDDYRRRDVARRAGDRRGRPHQRSRPAVSPDDLQRGNARRGGAIVLRRGGERGEHEGRRSRARGSPHRIGCPIQLERQCADRARRRERARHRDRPDGRAVLPGQVPGRTPDRTEPRPLHAVVWTRPPTRTGAGIGASAIRTSRGIPATTGTTAITTRRSAIRTRVFTHPTPTTMAAPPSQVAGR